MPAGVLDPHMADTLVHDVMAEPSWEVQGPGGIVCISDDEDGSNGFSVEETQQLEASLATFAEDDGAPAGPDVEAASLPANSVATAASGGPHEPPAGPDVEAASVTANPVATAASGGPHEPPAGPDVEAALVTAKPVATAASGGPHETLPAPHDASPPTTPAKFSKPFESPDARAVEEATLDEAASPDSFDVANFKDCMIFNNAVFCMYV